MPEEPEVFKKLAEAEAAPDLSVPFTGSYEMNQQIIEHKTWLKTIRHEKPSPNAHVRQRSTKQNKDSQPCHYSEVRGTQ